jgi:hypothetical protein
MEQNGKYWRTRHKSIITETILQMETQLNEFCKDRFVVATQLFQNDRSWVAMVYYKVPSNEPIKE